MPAMTPVGDPRGGEIRAGRPWEGMPQCTWGDWADMGTGSLRASRYDKLTIPLPLRSGGASMSQK